LDDRPRNDDRYESDPRQQSDFVRGRLLCALLAVIPADDDRRQEAADVPDQGDQVDEARQHLPVDELIDAAHRDPAGGRVGGDDAE
jgi:hypothetical protein